MLADLAAREKREAGRGPDSIRDLDRVSPEFRDAKIQDTENTIQYIRSLCIGALRKTSEVRPEVSAKLYRTEVVACGSWALHDEGLRHLDHAVVTRTVSRPPSAT